MDFLTNNLHKSRQHRQPIVSGTGTDLAVASGALAAAASTLGDVGEVPGIYLSYLILSYPIKSFQSF